MQRSELKLIQRADRSPPAASAKSAALLALILFVVASAATWLGADAARQPIDAREITENAVDIALERGSDDREVRGTLRGLRQALGRRPLDSRTRAAYASLLLSLSRSLEDRHAAAFHAQRAVELAPVTVPVVRASVLVLAHAGETERALEWVRHMFGYDAQSAAKLLQRIEPILEDSAVELGIPHEPSAWLAWRSQLLKRGQIAEADAWLERAYVRWPEDIGVVGQMSGRALARRDWPALGSLLPPERRLPDEPAAAIVLVHRAWLKAQREDARGAREDIDRARRLTDDDRWIRILGADVYEYLGEIDEARRLWSGALFGLPPGSDDVRREVLPRLARLEDRHGPPGKALRLWESVLEMNPGHTEARRRADDLSGFKR